VLSLFLHKFHSQIHEDLYKIVLLLIDIPHYLFNEIRGKGWNASDFSVVQSLFQHWGVVLEKKNGPNSKPLDHVAGAGHILDDVRRIGHSDVY
jgi:hypothetical protein